MQASKIMPGAVYAIMEGGSLVRFKVGSVNTRRFQATGSPHDYKSTVEGQVIDGPIHAVTVEPGAVLGSYEEYAELVEKKRREDAEREREGSQRVQALEMLWTMLYEKSGQPRPNDPRAYHQPFRVDVGGTIRIDTIGVKLLIDALKAGSAVGDPSA